MWNVICYKCSKLFKSIMDCVEEVIKILKLHLAVVSTLKSLEIDVLEARDGWYKHGRGDQWKDMWGHFGRHRFENARAALIEWYELEVPEQFRERLNPPRFEYDVQRFY